ncbi:hypothetical protein GUITHDRAFT_110487 [Guillardia theta CCMP2712]|uniref:Uncharacterized protein n=1 Tax=Guillardia theta (strain CCMP2712) TaxID=905079 RepID=L1J5S3_GUITC|nr:hypothetical protein GUITHDRAFT_110487 [Guillardia theta CCMP2712]EKX43687.1 hypothetical protein GUITHDRAFT_110487 [Guillardia theta CCMP2712]|eukprot:XP_005830667.1 hypothetical protein GUITHDRAFT_110487 [Guillardia theta CCMP2712]
MSAVSDEGVTLPPLVDQSLRPASASVLPASNAERQEEEYVILPPIDSASRMFEQSLASNQLIERASDARTAKSSYRDGGREESSSSYRPQDLTESSDAKLSSPSGLRPENAAQEAHRETVAAFREESAGEDSAVGLEGDDARAAEVGAEKKVTAGVAEGRADLTLMGNLSGGKERSTAVSPEDQQVGKVRESISADPTQISVHEGHTLHGRETAEQRLERIRNSNIRKSFRDQGRETLEGNVSNLSDDMQSTRASSPRRPRPADHEFGYKTEFETKSPGLNQDKAQRAGQQASAPYGKLQGHSESMVDVDPFAVKMQLRHMFLGFVDKSAPDLEEKPPAALSVEAGDASKLKFIDNLPEWVKGSDEFPRGVHGEGRKEWYGQDGHRAAIARIPTSGSSSETDRTEYRLQPATAHGFDVGFERTMAHNSLRSHGSQLQEKDLGEENFQARAEVAVAAPIKLPRQEGFMVDRNKDPGIGEGRAAAHRTTAEREQSVTVNNEITEESKLAHKFSRVLEGPGKLEDTDYDELDLRPSQLATKIKEKRGAYAVPKDQGQEEIRDARPIPMELQLKQNAFDRQKGSGEDKMRSAFY